LAAAVPMACNNWSELDKNIGFFMHHELCERPRNCTLRCLVCQSAMHLLSTCTVGCLECMGWHWRHSVSCPAV